jgi:D-alanyl-D-alanine carboxypeptidase
MEEENYTQQDTQDPMAGSSTPKKPIADVLSAPEYELNYGYILGALLMLMSIGFLVHSLGVRAEENGVEQGAFVVEALPKEEETVEPRIFVDPFDSIDIKAQAAHVYDIKTGRTLFSQNEETQLPLASITKLATAYVAGQYLAPDETITIEPVNLLEDGDSGLLAFDEWHVKDLIDFMLIVSSNDGADALARAAGSAKLVRSSSDITDPNDAFIEDMNKAAETLGLSQTYFLNETGLDPTSVKSGGYGSARDVSILMTYLVEHELELVDASTILSKQFTNPSGFVYNATNTNDAIPLLPGLLASKTGFTDLAGGNLVIAFDAGIDRPIVVTVLGSTPEDRYGDVVTLAQAALRYIIAE